MFWDLLWSFYEKCQKMTIRGLFEYFSEIRLESQSFLDVGAAFITSLPQISLKGTVMYITIYHFD